MKKQYLIIIFVIIVMALSFGRSFLGLIGVIPWHYGYSDVFNSDRIDPSVAAKIPYVEKPVEYPLLTGFFIYFMWYFGKGPAGYVFLTYIFLTVFAAITALLIYKLIKLLGLEEKNIWMFFVFAPSIIIFGVYNWDIIAVMFLAVALYLFHKGKPELSAFFLSLGFNSKIFPIFLLPFMLLKAGFKKGARMVVIFIAVFLILNVYFMINNFDLWFSTYTFHSSRAPNVDSIWHLTNLSAGIINLLSLILFSAFYILLMVFHRNKDIIWLGFLSILAFLILNKIFSPQYTLWLLPFFVLRKINKKIFYGLEFTNIAVFFLALYWLFISKETALLTMSNIFVILRSLILIYIVYKLIISVNNTIERTKNI